jgi:alpha-tubulin suppressor-like RCC1 family protein
MTGHPVRRKSNRHVINENRTIQQCWCGSSHAWALRRDGFCECADEDCQEVHRQ